MCVCVYVAEWCTPTRLIMKSTFQFFSGWFVCCCWFFLIPGWLDGFVFHFVIFQMKQVKIQLFVGMNMHLKKKRQAERRAFEINANLIYCRRWQMVFVSLIIWIDELGEQTKERTNETERNLCKFMFASKQQPSQHTQRERYREFRAGFSLNEIHFRRCALWCDNFCKTK